MLRKPSRFCFHDYIGAVSINLVGKTFAIHQISAKTTKVFSRLTCVVYGISFEISLFVFDLCYNRTLILTKVMIPHPKTPLV